MLRTSDGETEILLGNKQLLGIFFVVAILLGVAFAGGYKVGQGSKKAGNTASLADLTSPGTSTAGETHAVTPEGTAGNGGASGGATPETSTQPPQSDAAQTEPAGGTGAPLGSPLKKIQAQKPPPAEDSEAPGPASQAAGSQAAPATGPSSAGFTPQPGQMFLQVAAERRDEAEAIADVLRKKNFRAHAVPKAGTKLYRVLIGPIRDATDLNSTRASLRKTGFLEIFVQKY
jgi:cell division septation protein DedD